MAATTPATAATSTIRVTAATTPATVAVSTTTGVANTTASACPIAGTVGETSADFPARMSALVGVAIRTGARPCFERIVIELAPAADAAPSLELPGYWLRYTRSPVTDSPRGEQVDVRGNAVLLVQMGSWMGNLEGFGCRGPYDIAPTNVSHVQQLLLVNFEGQSAWAIGSTRPIRTRCSRSTRRPAW